MNVTGRTNSSSYNNTKTTTILADDDENLYSLDIFVKYAVHLITDQNTFSSNPSILDANNCCIGFRLWDFPLLYINQKNGYGSLVPFNKTEREQYSFKESVTARNYSGQHEQRVDVHCGKSCVFKMSEDNLRRNIIANPLYAFLFTLSPDEFNSRPILLGSTSINLESLGIPDTVDPTLTITNNHFKHHVSCVFNESSVVNNIL
jgi:hypothetical protein